ncbi:MAG: propionyl-CoA synthetase [Xanthomonadales bacterium]|nr:propionyl-CoA synthetase [Gammaproteobacteria bacterium]MBT8053213.1 propionyl-CoA synthetase [Gammaproteobacteria bacterium]NNK50253.1 propionyl-CoA synthetase [Xanthomonadales bacterium]
MSYQTQYKNSIEHPDQFWAEAAAQLDWTRPWDLVLDDSDPPFYEWFSGGEINTCFNALDRHCEAGRGSQAALIYDSPVTGQIRTYSYDELTDQVARFAGVLREYGVGQGDRVIVYMPMIPEAVISMLACARIGAIHSVVFGGFAAKELATRVVDAGASLIISASCGIEGARVIPYLPLLEEALSLAKVPDLQRILVSRPQLPIEELHPCAVLWEQAMESAEPVDCVPVAATDPIYILYTSGTTGEPKGVVRPNGGHAVALKWTMDHIYNVKPGEVYWAASDIGWVVGHSYIVYAPLLHGCTTLLYEGKPVGTPDASAFWRVIEQHKVKCLFTAPTAFRAIRREDPEGKLLHQHDISSLDTLFLAGERCDPDTLHWAEKQLEVPVIDHWWQTESGWAMAGNPMGIEPLPVKAGSPTVPVPGYNICVLDDEGNDVTPGESGNIVVKLPLPPGTLPTLWGNRQRYYDTYLSRFEGYYLTGDAGVLDEAGYLWVMSRIDDVINVAGHRLSTGSLEEALATHPMVAECAVIGVEDKLKGEMPLGFVVLNAGVDVDQADLKKELMLAVRSQVGPIATPRDILVVGRLPKTRSGKILRGTMRKIADGQTYTTPATIEDPAVLQEIASALDA